MDLKASVPFLVGFILVTSVLASISFIVLDNSSFSNDSSSNLDDNTDSTTQLTNDTDSTNQLTNDTNSTVNFDFLSLFASTNSLVIINSVSYSLDVYLWRDFMPGAYTGNGSTLLAVTHIVPANSNFSFVYAWFYCDKDLWETPNATPIDDSGYHFNDGNNGPRWDIGSTVYIVLKFYNIQTDEFILLRAQGIINQTW